MTHLSRRGGSGRNRGSALFATVVAIVVFTGMTVAMVMISTAQKKDLEAAVHRHQRRLMADAGISDAYANLTARGSGNIGSETSPRIFGEGAFFVATTDNGDGTFTVRSTGTVGADSRMLEAVMREVPEGVFAHSVFAGNSSGDSTYTLTFGGTGSSADHVSGDMYSGNDLAMTGDATATGTLRAAGVVSGATGESGVTSLLPDIAGMNYPLNHDVNVAAEFSTNGTLTVGSSFGGTATHVPEENPAHIFRKNPDDRSVENLGTAKDDYYLEDPYEDVNETNGTDPNNSTFLSLSGVSGEPGISGTRKVYYIDGNLWVHNYHIYSFALKHADPQGVQITFVARGNIYFSDNILIKNPVKDGVAFIAIKDPDVVDSGNVYFGDATFGTLERMDAYVYAENNFYDSNLDASGSASIEINGIMSAGNQILIDRDHDNGSHTKLTVNFDERVESGSLLMPGLPGTTGSASRQIDILTVYEVGLD